MSYTSLKTAKKRSIFSLYIAFARIHAVVRNDITHLEKVKPKSQK